MFHLRFGLSDHLKALLDFVFGSRRRVKKVRIFRAWFSHSSDVSDLEKFDEAYTDFSALTDGVDPQTLEQDGYGHPNAAILLFNSSL